MIEQLYSHYRANNYRYIRYRVRGKEAAEDLLHDAVLIMLTTKTPPEDAYGYFCGVVKHLLSHNYRQRRDMVSLDGDNDSALADNTPDIADNTPDTVDLYDLLNTLSERERQAVLLSHIQQLKSESVGQALGVSAAAARKLTQRAIEKMRKAATLDTVCQTE